ncbi:MAG TPA: hypothetical protein VFE50_22385 [Cyclobacteriaceae bacterium]|nr:hypothetical protein [Cyclobacteriaceae bacterium]
MSHTISLYYFPKGLRYTAPIEILGSIWLWYENYVVWGVILLLVGIFILTAKYITVIGEHEFSDAFGFFGIKIVTEKKKFKKLNKIVITKGSYSQNINTRSSSRQLDWTDYTGTLIYDDDQSLDLVTTEDKSQLVNELKVYASFLRVSIEDSTGRLIFSPS